MFNATNIQIEIKSYVAVYIRNYKKISKNQSIKLADNLNEL